MDVLFLHSFFSSPNGQVSSRSYDLCRGLVERGHKVTVITQIGPFNSNVFENTSGFIRYFTLDGIEMVGIAVPYANRMGIFSRLCSFFAFMILASFVAMRTKPVDIVFATSTPPTIVVPGLAVKWLRRVPFVLELRDIWPDFVEQLDVLPNMPKSVFRFIDSIMKWTYRRADRVTTTTPGMTEIVAGKGIKRGKLGTILLGSKNELFEKVGKPHQLLESPVLRGRFVVCYLGSISYGYDLDRLLNIAALMRDSDPEVAFLIVGRGGDRERLSERIRNDALTNVVMGPAVEYKYVPDILMHVQVGYESSYPSAASDTAFDNKFYDYMAAGLPILTNYNGDMKAFLEDRDCGRLAEDPETGARQIREWASRPEERTRLSGNARKAAQGVLSRSLQVQYFAELLRWVHQKGQGKQVGAPPHGARLLQPYQKMEE